MLRKRKNALELALFLVLLSMVVVGITKLMERKDAAIAKQEFYQSEDTYDVYFMGTSRILNAAFPMELWNSYGITSYNLSGHAQFLPVTYWVLKDAFTRKKPKVVVVDVYAVSAEDKVYTADMAYLHNSLDVIPLSVNKVKAVYDLLPEGTSKMEYLWDFSIYHRRWEELSKQDVEVAYTLEKGAEARIAVEKVQKPELLSVEEYNYAAEHQAEEKTMGEQYLEKIIDLCQKEEIQVVLVNLPQYADAEGQRLYAGVEEIARRKGVKYLNFLNPNLSDIVNFNTDIYDQETHLNPSGARKITAYLGQILQTEYLQSGSLQTKEENKQAKWDEAYQVYRRFLLEKMKEAESLSDVLMMAAEEQMEVEITIGTESRYKKRETFQALLQNLKEQAKKVSVIESESYGRKQISVRVSDYAIKDGDNQVIREF